MAAFVYGAREPEKDKVGAMMEIMIGTVSYKEMEEYRIAMKA